VGPTASSITVTPERALGVPAVFACVEVLAQDVAKTAIKLRRKTATDTYEDAIDHPLFEILNSLPNPEQTAYQVKAAMMRDLLTHGRAYAEIVRDAGRVTALWPLDAHRMRVDRDAARRKRWTYSAQDGRTYTWTFDPSMPPIFELTHDTPITRCHELIGTAIAHQIFTGKFFANGATVRGVLQASGMVKADTATRVAQAWRDMFGKPDNAQKVAVLEGGLEYKPIGMKNDEAQMNEYAQTLRVDIAGAFRVPTWKIGDLSKATYSNMEAGAIEYVTGTLDPYFTAWELAIRRDLLTTRQFGQFDVIFDRQSLIRSDVKSLHDALATGRQNGFYSANDARKALGLNPIADGDAYLVNSALVPIAQAGENTNVIAG
jgi:HK97 family phage portal protein